MEICGQGAAVIILVLCLYHCEASLLGYGVALQCSHPTIIVLHGSWLHLHNHPFLHTRACEILPTLYRILSPRCPLMQEIRMSDLSCFVLV